MMDSSTKEDKTRSMNPMVFINLFFSVMAIVGQVAMNVSIPLFTSNALFSSSSNYNTSNNNSAYQPRVDAYFLASFTAVGFVLLFGCITLILLVVQLTVNLLTGKRQLAFITVEDDLLFPQWQLMLIGLFLALTALFVMFSSPTNRTAPFLQAILGNIAIPMTIFFRFVLLRKRPTMLKLLCSLAVFLGLVISLIPIFVGMDYTKAGQHRHHYLKQSHLGQILWPLCYMLAYVPLALMNVIAEKSLKDTKRVNIFYLLTCICFYQMLVIWLLFGLDIIPYFGYADSLEHFKENYKLALQCVFGGAGCSHVPGIACAVLIVAFFTTRVGGGALLRYAEGATYLAIVQSLVSPLGALFWSVFMLDYSANLIFYPHVDTLTYFSITGMVIMVPAIFLYNIGTFSGLRKLITCEKTKSTENVPLLLPPSSADTAVAVDTLSYNV